MFTLKQIRTAVRRRALGENILPEEFTTGIVDPQQEISVVLDGIGDPVDVTFRHSSTGAAPFLIAVALDSDPPASQVRKHLSLKFYERGGDGKLLGEIGLRLQETIPMTDCEIFLFAPSSASNHCLPKISLYAHYCLHLYRQWQSPPYIGMDMTFLERRAAMVSFIRPHPTVLVSVEHERSFNMFPMNVMGALGTDRFGFALRNDRLAGKTVERAGRLVISNVPQQKAPMVYGMAGNHAKGSIQLGKLPFLTKPSAMFQLPVPEFALRVREMELEKVHILGSHTFYMARIVQDTVCSTEPSLSIIHGYLQTRRLRGDAAKMKAALHKDSRNKHGGPVF